MSENGFRISILGRSFSIYVIDADEDFGLSINGRIKYNHNTIKVWKSAYDPWLTLWHEIAHAFYNRFGDMVPDDLEVACDLFANMIDALILENGVDIFERLKMWLEEQINDNSSIANVDSPEFVVSSTSLSI